jgi:hypothetical protein
MPTRRTIVLAAAFGGLVSGAGAADASARAFVTAIYNAYRGKMGNGISLDSDTNVRRYFEPSLAALITKDKKDAAREGDAPTLATDPFVDAQDWEIAAFDVAIRDTAPGKASATVTFRNFNKPTAVVLDLIKLRNDWRVADIAWQREGKTETLRALFAAR